MLLFNRFFYALRYFGGVFACWFYCVPIYFDGNLTILFELFYTRELTSYESQLEMSVRR